MISIFSCAAYRHFDEVLASCKQLEQSINEALEDSIYGPIHFLVVQFSTLTLIEPQPPEIDNEHTISMIVDVNDTSPAHLSKALMQGLDSEVVPDDLRTDLEAVLIREGWL